MNPKTKGWMVPHGGRREGEPLSEQLISPSTHLNQSYHFKVELKLQPS